MGKTAAIYNPYLDTLGGGERYMLSFAKALSDFGYDVDIEWNDSEILNKLTSRFGLKVGDNVKVVNSINRGENYDLCFWVSDGSIPILRSKNNFIHFQVPFQAVNGNSLINKMKLFRINKIICNSDFTKKVIDREYGVNSDILYPPIDIQSFKPMRKENNILYVGRFSNLLQSKGQETLIEVFKDISSNIPEWKLILAGGVEVGSDKLIKKLESIIDCFPIELVKSPSFETLKELYGKSKIFWSASGYNIDQNTNPQRVEHFGMTLVESMSAGLVPVVVKAGGHKEIVENEVNGYLWESKRELSEFTKKIVNTKGLLNQLSKNSIESAKKFSYEVFKSKVEKLIV